MKKSSIKKICAATTAIVATLILIIVLQSRTVSIPYFEFLKHPKPFVKNIEYNKGTSGTKNARFYYAFVTDFNDFYARASEELSKLNFIRKNSSIYSMPKDSTVVQPRLYGCEWIYMNSGGSVNVSIYLNYKLSDEEKDLQKLYTGSIYAEDCVAVYIQQRNEENPLIYMLKLFSSKLLD